MQSCLSHTLHYYSLIINNCANNNHFLHHERLFQSVRSVCAFRSILSVSYHPSSAGDENEVGSGAAHPRWGGEPKEGSILIKGLGAKPRLKIETEGDWHRFLQALTARLTAALRRRAVEPSRESARLPMMRWDGKITSDKPSTRHPSLITLSAHTHKQTHIERKSNYHMHACTHTLRDIHTCCPLSK